MPNLSQMDLLIKLNNQTAGRDKLARLAQYLSKLIWYRLQQRSNQGGVNSFKNLEYQLSTFRKLLRFGRFIDSIYSSLSILKNEDVTIRYSVSISKFCNGLYLLADHLLWLGRADVCQVNTDKWSKLSNTSWLYSIILNLVRDFYEITIVLRSNRDFIIPDTGVINESALKYPSTHYYGTLYRSLYVLSSNRIVMVDLMKNCCDLLIPLTALGHLNLSPGTVGFLGVMSSLAALAVLVDPSLKLLYT